MGSAVTLWLAASGRRPRRPAARRRPMLRSISAPTIAACWWRGRRGDRFRVIDAFSRIIRLGEGIVGVRPHQRCGDRARGRGARRLPRQDGQPRRHARAPDRHRSMPCGRERRRIPRPHRERRSGSSSRSSTARPRRRSPPPGCTPLIDPEAEGVILFDIGGGSSELVRLGRSRADAARAAAAADPSLGVVAGRRGDARRAIRRTSKCTPEIYEAMIEEVKVYVAHPAASETAHDRAHRRAPRGQRPAPSLRPRRVVSGDRRGPLVVPLPRTHAARARSPRLGFDSRGAAFAISRTRTASRLAPSREPDRPECQTDYSVATAPTSATDMPGFSSSSSTVEELRPRHVICA